MFFATNAPSHPENESEEISFLDRTLLDCSHTPVEPVKSESLPKQSLIIFWFTR